jgi:hypothetical protein
MADARKGWKLAGSRVMLRELEVEGRMFWLSETQYLAAENVETSDTIVNLLPAFDSLVLGYSDREYIVPGKYQKEVYHGGQTVPVVLVDGRAGGVWRYERHGRKLEIRVDLFEPLKRTVRTYIEEESEDVGRFLGLQASLSYCP